MAKLTRRWTSSPVLSILTASFAGVVKLVWPSLGISRLASPVKLFSIALTLLEGFGRIVMIPWNFTLPKTSVKCPSGECSLQKIPTIYANHTLFAATRNLQTCGINVWTSTSLEHASYDAPKKAWTLEVVCNNERLLPTAKHLVLAIGPGVTIPKMPTFPNREAFNGKLMHSVNYMNCDSWAGKKGVIIGSANTAHDIAEDMLQAGLQSVTMIQRSETCVVPAEYRRANIEPMYGPNSKIEILIASSRTCLQLSHAR